MKKVLLITALLGFLAACEPHPVNFAYSKPNNLGFFDPRATPVGTVFAWNTETNRIVRVGETALHADTPSGSRTVEGDSLKGFGVEGLPLSDTKIVEAEIANKFKTIVKDSIRQPYSQVISGLRDFVVERKQHGGLSEEDIEDIFRGRDDKYRTVIVVAQEMAGHVSIRAGQPEGKDRAKFKIQLASSELVTVSINSVTESKCGGVASSDTTERAICFVEFAVYDPHYQENGNLGWSRDDGFDASDLAEALRNM